jgi:hypothetical protein
MRPRSRARPKRIGAAEPRQREEHEAPTITRTTFPTYCFPAHAAFPNWSEVGIRIVTFEDLVITQAIPELGLAKAPADAPETIGDPVPQNIELHSLPSEVAAKVSQARSHSFFIKDGNNAIVLVSPNDRRVADVIH